MSTFKIASWNVNGIRSNYEKGFFLKWLKGGNYDMVFLQEVRAPDEKIPKEINELGGYHKNWFAAQKAGYSGVGALTKEKPIEVINGLGIEKFDCEGRVQTLVFDHLTVVNAYFPNSQDEGKRLPLKLEFCKAMEKHLKKFQPKPVILCGDYNIAHQPIDLARPEDNEKTPGYFPEERQWMSHFLESGWIDIFRLQNPTLKDAYSWWSARTRARERNVGWRIDYHCISPNSLKYFGKASIESEVLGSDHCPVIVEFTHK